MATKTTIKKFNNDEEIDVINYTTGKCIYINPRTGTEYIWDGFGDIQPVPFGDLVVMKASKPKYMTEPILIFNDEEIIKHFGLTKLYKNILKPDEIENFYNMDEEDMVEFLINATDQTKRIIVVLTRQMIARKELDSVFTVRLIESTLNEDDNFHEEISFFEEL